MFAPKFMNEIFYNQKNFLKSQENFLSDLEPYMLTPDVWAIRNAIETKDTATVTKDIATVTKDTETVTNTIETVTKVTKSHIFKPGLRDSIFWCMYVAINGESYYQSQLKSGTNMINLMMNEKKAISDHFNNNSALLKNSNHKITLAKINEIKCNLMTKPMMDSVESFIPCSIYFGRPIYVYFEEIHSYLLFVDKNYVSDNDCANNDDYVDPNIILLYGKDGRFTLETNVSDFLKNKDSFFHIQHYEKPLSGISNYKTDEIQTIYKKVFGEDENLKKTEYYEKVLVKCTAVVSKGK
jgi:hypothetical protein